MKPCSTLRVQFSSVQSLSASDSLQPHGLQHARPPCPSPPPEVYSNSCPLSHWCHLTISSFVTPFSSCPPSFPASGSLPMSCLFTSGGPSIGDLALASVLPRNIKVWFPLGLPGWSSCCLRDSQESSSAPQFKSITSLVLNILYSSTLTSLNDYWKNHNFNCMYMDFCLQSDISGF